MNKLRANRPAPGIYTLYVLWAIACFAFFQFVYHYHFLYQEQNQLFLWSTDYLKEYLNKPGWFACMVGDFLTQFYHLQYAGPAILTIVLLLLGHDVRRALQYTGMKSSWIPYLVSFITMTVCAALSLYHDYRLSNILAVWGGANVFCFSTHILTNTRFFIKKIEHMQKNGEVIEGHTLPHWISAISIAITVPVCHWFFGSGVWTYCLLVMIGCLTYIMQPYNYLRLGSMVGMMFLLLLTKRLYFVSFEDLYTYPSFGKFVKPEMDMEKDFAVAYEYDRGNYNKVMNIVEKDEVPTKRMKFYYNLVVAQNKSLSDHILDFPDNCLGTLESIDANTSDLTIKSLGELYWLLGDMNYAERAAILSNINSPQSRNIRQVKRMAEINLVLGEQEAAKKYLRILQKTFVWRHWADRVFAGMGRFATAEDLATIKPYLDKQKFVNTRDTLRADDSCYAIMTELAESNPANNLAINYMLCTDLLAKNLAAFKHNYDAYYLKQPHVLYDPMYQQALILYLDSKNAPAQEWSKYVKRPEIWQRYKQYKADRGNAAFSGTYWYYYDKGIAPKANRRTSNK